MTLDSYRNFVTIVDCGSIVAAANKLLIAQPSLSNQLKNIEKPMVRSFFSGETVP